MSESRMIVQAKGSYWINKAGLYHRIDGPAIEYVNGTTMWCLNGLLHRVGGPAIEYVNRTKEWYQQGKRHRVDGPAIEWSNGSEGWYLEGNSYPSKEAWFNALTKEDQIAYLFNMEAPK